MNKSGKVMKTCAYCGSMIQPITENKFFCSFCDMYLSSENVLENGDRKDHTIDHIPFEYDFNKSTKDLMQLKTIELLYLLRFVRKNRSELYGNRILGHKVSTDEIGQELLKVSYDEYEKTTRKMWVIENIIKDRIGYYPPKLSDDFLILYMERIIRSQEKKMIIQSSRTAKNN